MKFSFKNSLIWVILGMFILSGILQTNFSGNNPILAYVGNKQIRLLDVKRYAKLIQIPADLNRDLPEVQNYLLQTALNVLIKNALITLECENLGLVVSDAKVVDYIKMQPEFCVNDEFSRSLFLSELHSLNLTEQEYIQLKKENLLHKQWYFILEQSYQIKDEMVKKTAKAHVQKRSFRYSIVNIMNLPSPKITDNILFDYYKKNPAIFTVPETKVYEIIEIENSELINDFSLKLKNQNFDGLKNKSDVKCFSYNEFLATHSASDISHLNYLLKNNDLGKSKNSGLYPIGQKYYAFKVIDIKPSFLPDFVDIKEEVKQVYVKNYKKNQANKISHTQLKWRSISDLKFNESYFDLPDYILEKIFKLAPGKIYKFENKDEIYFIIIDKITEGNINQIDMNFLRNSISADVLEKVINASLGILRNKYKVDILI